MGSYLSCQNSQESDIKNTNDSQLENKIKELQHDLVGATESKDVKVDLYSEPDEIPISTKDQPMEEKLGNSSVNDSNIESEWRRLKEFDFGTIPYHTFRGKLIQSKIDDVHDGDTVSIGFFESNIPKKFHFRLGKCDAPEIKPKKDTPDRDLHIKAGLIVTNIVVNLIAKKCVWILFDKEEKFGRLMGDISLPDKNSPNKLCGNELNIAQWLIKNKYAKTYHGEKKPPWTKKELDYIISTGMQDPNFTGINENKTNEGKTNEGKSTSIKSKVKKSVKK